MAPFEPGRLVLRRQFQRGPALGRVWAGHVVADDERGLWIWIAAGSVFRDVAAADGRTFRQVPFGEWGRTATAMRALTWQGDVLMLHPPGAAYSSWLFFTPDGTFRQWYVNLEEPLVRWDDGGVAGIDTVDQDLDLVVSPDRAWVWKDEDEFAEHLAHPEVYWVDDAPAVWAQGRRVAALIETGEFPFDGTGTGFRPDPGWPVPAELPPGWDRPRA